MLGKSQPCWFQTNEILKSLQKLSSLIHNHWWNAEDPLKNLRHSVVEWLSSRGGGGGQAGSSSLKTLTTDWQARVWRREPSFPPRTKEREKPWRTLCRRIQEPWKTLENPLCWSPCVSLRSNANQSHYCWVESLTSKHKDTHFSSTTTETATQTVTMLRVRATHTHTEL